MRRTIDRILEETKRDYPNHLATVSMTLIESAIDSAKTANVLGATSRILTYLNEALYTIEKYRELK